MRDLVSFTHLCFHINFALYFSLCCSIFNDRTRFASSTNTSRYLSLPGCDCFYPLLRVKSSKCSFKHLCARRFVMIFAFLADSLTIISPLSPFVNTFSKIFFVFFSFVRIVKRNPQEDALYSILHKQKGGILPHAPKKCCTRWRIVL